MNCRIPLDPVEVHTEVKRSRFLATVAHAPTATEAQRVISARRQQHPDANHVCWAFIAGVPGRTTALGCSDDGEPAGTAGKPMLNVLQHGDIGFVVAATVRYFGGTKLGTGGLVRAYTQSLVTALDALTTAPWRERTALKVSVPYATESTVRHLIDSHRADIQSVAYSDTADFDLLLDADACEPLINALNNACAGQITVHGT